MTSPDWQRLGTAIKQARGQLTQQELAERAGVTDTTIRVLETARRTNFRSATLRAVSAAVGWTPDSAQRILDGGEPLEEEPDFGDRLDRLESQLSQVLDILQAQQRRDADSLPG